jgi:SAM-dependent methyltransferase
MTYPDTYFTARESWRDWRIEAGQLLDLADVSRGKRVLEIGCGGGGLLRRVSGRGAVGIGVDVLQAALELAQRRDSGARRLSLICIGMDSRLPIRGESLDAVIGQHVVEHIRDVDAAIQEWKRVLARGGRLVLATPNARYPNPSHFADADHVHIYTPAELSGLVMQAGFQVEHCSTIFPFLTQQRALRAAGVIAYRAFRRLPYFDRRGRTILISAVKP